MVVGAGGCGMVASLAAAEQSARVVLLEKTGRPGGNTAMSQGMIPAAGTRFQSQAGIHDSPELMAQDIFRKNNRESDAALTLLLCAQSKHLVEWLVDVIGIDLRLVTEFAYPGHTRLRMHAPPTWTGQSLVADLVEAVRERDKILVALNTPVRSLVTDDHGDVVGVIAGTEAGERIKCRKVILALNGFGANPDMIRQYCPTIATAIYHNHPGNTGDGIEWGTQLGAALENMGAFQGHASVSYPDNIMVTWAVIMSGGILVNRDGNRFGDETKDYSAYALDVLDQPEGLAFDIFGEESYEIAAKGSEFQELMRTQAIKKAGTIEELAGSLNIDGQNLERTIGDYNLARSSGGDTFGRTDFGSSLSTPLFGIQVTAALFHTQGGLRVDSRARLLRSNGDVVPNLYAGGGTAVGISGSGPAGYLSGNGLLTALGWGKIAGEDAARTILGL
ncbi:MAG: FAD-dependent oxidoreductase [Chloroflexi bacterium]|nr:FAD-dependent oxidoreductase [Chloroflexota bacterium]